MSFVSDSIYLKSYSELEQLRKYIDAQGHLFNIEQHNQQALDKLVSIIGIIALGEKSLNAIDKFYANDYFKSSLNLKHYERFNLADFVNSETFNSLIAPFQNAIPLTQESEADIAHLLSFETGQFNTQLLPLFIFTHHFLVQHQQSRHTSADLFKKIDFTENLNEEFLKNGYLVIPDFLNPQEISKLKEITHELARDELTKNQAYLYGNGNKLQRVFNIINKDKQFRDLLCCSTVIDILEKIFDRDTLHQKYYLSSFQANILNPGAEAQKLHVDSSVPDPLPPWLIRININFILDDFTESNGATLVSPGSHTRLRKPKENEDVELIKILAPAGSILIWTGHLWHKSGENQSNQSRTALLACFVASYLREVAIEENYLEVMSKDTIASSPKVLQNMLGIGHGIKQGAYA